MKSISIGLFMALALFLTGFAIEAQAFTLGYPDVSFDSSQGPGADLFTSQGVSFNSSTGILAVSAQAQSISFNGSSSINLTDGTVDYSASLLNFSSNGSTITANFGTSSASPADLVISDSSGTLLTGNFSSFVMTGIIGSNIGTGVATFTVTGGSLASDFGGSGATGGVVNLDFNISPSFSATSFNSNFNGSVKGDIAPVVPIPSALLLMGTGLAILVLFHLKRTPQT